MDLRNGGKKMSDVNVEQVDVEMAQGKFDDADYSAYLDRMADQVMEDEYWEMRYRELQHADR